MWLDSDSLTAFYQTPLGKLAAGSLVSCLQRLWPDLERQHVLALGYGLPLATSLEARAERLILASSPVMGPLAWPKQADLTQPQSRQHRMGRSLLLDGHALPFADQGFDRIVLLHHAEFSRDLFGLTQELARVLADGGEMVLILPNRAGLWSRSERTPFGYGLPFTPIQTARLLKTADLEIIKAHGGLYFPPRNTAFIRNTANRWERLGGRWARLVAGVLILQVRKTQDRKLSLGRKRPALVNIAGLLEGMPLGAEPAHLKPVPVPVAGKTPRNAPRNTTPSKSARKGQDGALQAGGTTAKDWDKT